MKPNVLDLAKQTKALAEKATPGRPGRCQRCGEVLPRGEEMFLYHGYSGNCPIWHPKPAFDVNLAIAAPQLADAVVELSGQLSSLQTQRDEMVEALQALKDCAENKDQHYDDLQVRDEVIHVARELLTKLGLGTNQAEGE